MEQYHSIAGLVDRDSLIVFMIGAAVGLIEIVSRHSDYRFAAARTPPALIYILLNGTICLLALWLIESTRPAWLGFSSSNSTGDSVYIVLTAGFGATAFLRTSLFKLKTPEGDLPVGPALVTDQLLNLFDEAVDRSVGTVRIRDVSRIMRNVDFNKAAKNLPTLCFASLRRLPPESQQEFAAELKALFTDPDLEDMVRARGLGLKIMARTGREILVMGVADLGQAIGRDGADKRP